MSEFVLHGRPGWGSAIVEAQLDWYAIPYRFEEVGDLFASPEARLALSAINPLAQIPTLVLPNGEVMSESAAITLVLAEYAGDATLVPSPGAPERAAFLRWLVFLIANIYPTFTYADDPQRFVEAPCAPAFREKVDAYAQKLWRMMEGVAGQPFFLGERRSALDIYLAVMTQWRPKPPWFRLETPNIAAIAAAARREPRLKGVFERNFPGQ